MAAMATLLRASSSYYSYTTNQTIDRRIIINPPPTTTRISFPITHNISPTITQNPLLKITTATTTTKCSNNNNNNSSSRGSTIDPVPLEKVGDPMVKEIVDAVKGLEKPALTALLVWVLLTNNPIIVSSPFSRTTNFWIVWFTYDVCKLIATKTRMDDGTIEFSLGPVLGSIIMLPKLLMAWFGFGFGFGFGGWKIVTSVKGTRLTFPHKIIEYMMVIMSTLLGSWKLSLQPESEEGMIFICLLLVMIFLRASGIIR